LVGSPFLEEDRTVGCRRHIALLRGINVGRARRLAMADLRAVVAGLGHAEVRTVLASGNVMFVADGDRECDEMAAGLHGALVREKGIDADVTVLTAVEFDGVVQANPLLDLVDDPSRLLVAVPSVAAGVHALAALPGEGWSPDVLAVGPRAAYVWCPGGILGSRVLVAVERALSGAVTSRNWSTVLKLHALACPAT